MSDQQDLQELELALSSLESTAFNFGTRFIPDSMVRVEYNRKAGLLSKEILDKVVSGKISVKEGAKQASEMRNILMDTLRGKTSEIARAYAVKQKSMGKSLPELEQKYAKKLYNLSFESLSPNNRNKVWKEIVFSSGRPQLSVNKLAKVFGAAGRGFIALSLTISVYNITTADDVLEAASKESAVLGGGLLGSVAGGAAAGFACGPGAPVCVTIGVFVGGVMFAIGSQLALESLWN
ncbi:MAG: hypothetical protein AAFZ92_11050 [Pseudomonadota bacterium]